MNEKPIHVSDVKDPKISMIELGWSHVSKIDEFLKNAEAILKTGAMIRTLGSGTMLRAVDWMDILKWPLIYGMWRQHSFYLEKLVPVFHLSWKMVAFIK